MSREWQAEDVVVHPEHGRGIVSSDPGWVSALQNYDGGIWVEFAQGASKCIGEVADDLYKLAVVDPENPENVARLAEAIADAGLAGDWGSRSEGDRARAISGLAAALREYADPQPPKPAEPTRWLAAVEDPETGQRWYRDGDKRDSDCPWREVRQDGIHARMAWDDLPRGVVVLSEGVGESGE
jgi:hypothetical protein